MTENDMSVDDPRAELDDLLVTGPFHLALRAAILARAELGAPPAPTR